ncbi:hypothetical protein GH868_30640, partial [Bacillus thuringiensis]|nr:hypothetical protein [Bacillus thuringiensis]
FKNNSYVLKEFHFHWGEDKTRGSEHMINGEQFPLEMHLVHHLEQKSTTPNDVKKVAVLGVLFREGKEDNFLYKSVIGGLGRT